MDTEVYFGQLSYPLTFLATSLPSPVPCLQSDRQFVHLRLGGKDSWISLPPSRPQNDPDLSTVDAGLFPGLLQILDATERPCIAGVWAPSLEGKDGREACMEAHKLCLNLLASVQNHAA